MLYFVGHIDTPGSWGGSFTRAVRQELIRRRVVFRELPPFTWHRTNISPQHYLSIDSKPDDVWLIGWAQSPLIEMIKDKKGCKYGLVVGLTATPFEPAVLWEVDRGLSERRRLALYDGIFANSHWCRECICRAYPELAEKVVVTGFPIDFSVFDPFREAPKDPELVVFNQRFALEKLHVLEVELADRLLRDGFRVQHLSGLSESEISAASPPTRALLDRSRSTGLEFVHNPSKEAYHRNLAAASVVVTTSIADMLPSSLIEAIYMGAVPVAPRSLCFPEFVHSDNLYTPYDLGEIISVVKRRPVRRHRIEQYEKAEVIGRMFDEMHPG